MSRPDPSIEALRDGPVVRVFVACTGGGAGLQQMLWNVPGASRFLAGAAFPYAAEDTDAFLGFTPDRYCDGDIAIELAMAAYVRAWKPHIDHAVGIGLTAVVATDREHRGDHRVFVASLSRKGCRLTSARLTKGVGARARARDGSICDRLGLGAILAAAGHAAPAVPEVEVRVTDASARAFELFGTRPFFAADGTRHASPPPAVHFPGTFDPPHTGHLDVAERIARLGRRVLFTIEATPPHKPTLSVPVLLERAQQLRGRDRLFTFGEALYIEKIRRWHSDLAIGTDALARMLDPTWGVDRRALLEELEQLGAHVFVAEREIDGSWLRLDDLPIPTRFRHLFTNLGPCHCDSSTDHRAARVAARN